MGRRQEEKVVKNTFNDMLDKTVVGLQYKSLVRKKNYFMGGKCQIHNVKFQDKTISSSSGKNLFSPKIQCSVRSQNVY